MQCNEFINNAEIKKFATNKYDVQFDMYHRMKAHPLWKHLKTKYTAFLVE